MADVPDIVQKKGGIPLLRMQQKLLEKRDHRGRQAPDLPLRLPQSEEGWERAAGHDTASGLQAGGQAKTPPHLTMEWEEWRRQSRMATAVGEKR